MPARRRACAGHQQPGQVRRCFDSAHASWASCVLTKQAGSMETTRQHGQNAPLETVEHAATDAPSTALRLVPPLRWVPVAASSASARQRVPTRCVGRNRNVSVRLKPTSGRLASCMASHVQPRLAPGSMRSNDSGRTMHRPGTFAAVAGDIHSLE